VRTALGQCLEEGGTHPLAGHLHQPKVRNLEGFGSGSVPPQVAPEFVGDSVSVLLSFHVDEVANDDASDISEAKLFGDLPSRIQVRLEDGVLRVLLLLSGEFSGVHIDGNQRLGGLDDDVPARGEVHPLLEGQVDLIVDLVSVEEGEVIRIEVQSAQKIRIHVLDVLRDLGMDLRVIDRQRLEFVAE
jgi:hypothetical protein